MEGQRKHYSVQIDERMPSYPTPEPVLSFRACNTYGVCIKSFLLQEEILKNDEAQISGSRAISLRVEEKRNEGKCFPSEPEVIILE